ncbi:MAG: hypothetical protein IJX63_05655, partial [Lachnospiraceae bacterium]|nr:hypothetical protein [Lachnospiraceae bacterium]
HMNLIRMHLNCATAYYCIKPTGIMENKAEYHFSVAASSAEKVVVENRTKKKKGFLQSILNIQPRSMINYDYPVHIISQQVDFHIMPNSGPIPGIDERIHSYFESFQPRENVSAYLSDDMIRILEEIKLDIH